MVQVTRHSNARSFLRRSKGWLLRSEPAHSVVLSVPSLLLGNDHPFEPPVYLATVESAGRVCGCALQPPPDGLTLTNMPAAALPELARDMAQVCATLPDVSGPEPETTAFAQSWVTERCGRWSVAFNWRWYAATSVVESRRPAPGALRLARSSDLDLLTAWADDYARDSRTRVDVRAFFERRVRSDSLYLWEHGQSRSLVTVSGATPNSVRISAVYTPPESRGHGYATAIVTAVTQLMLDSGRRWCVLLAELANPTANSIYRRIGYRPTCDTIGIDFSAE